MRGFKQDMSSKDLSFANSAYKTKMMFLSGFATFLRMNSVGNTPGSIVAKQLYPPQQDNC
jgi:hypothetical protein